MKNIKKFESFVNSDGELIDFNDFLVDNNIIEITYLLNNDTETVYKGKYEVKDPSSLDSIKRELQELEDKHLDRGLWLDAKFEYDNEYWQYNSGILYSTDSTPLRGGELAQIEV